MRKLSVKINKWFSKIDNFFISYYRYPFKLVVRKRRVLSDIHYPEDRYSPPGFNAKNSETEYDLYLEPLSIKKLSNVVFSILFSLILTVSIFSIALSMDDFFGFLDFDSLFCLLGPSITFLIVYLLLITSIFYYYHSAYPLFSDVWSKKMDSYSEWFFKIPQEIHLNKKEDHKKIKKHLSNKKMTQKLERQALYYSWNSGSPQKSIWLLAIENVILEWEKNGILRKNTSLFVFLSPIFSSYVALIIVLIFSSFFSPMILDRLSIVGLVWLILSIFYLLFIYLFIVERRQNETQMNTNINRLIPYELRSATYWNNNIYHKFKEKSFLSLVSVFYSVMYAFYLTLIEFLK